MKAALTGASGFIGRHLTAELLRREWELNILSHKKPIAENKNCHIIPGDITEPTSLIRIMEGTDTVFHLAAALGASLIDQDAFFRVNVTGTRNVLAAAQEAGVKNFIHFSSAGVLGAVKKDDTADEDYSCEPINIYDQTKLEAERIVLNKGRKGLKVIVIRPGWVYGPGDQRTFKLIKAIAGRKFLLVTQGNTRQTPVYIDDLIHGTLLCWEKGEDGEIYNLTGTEVLTVKQMTEIIAQAVGTSIPRFNLPKIPAIGAAWILEKLFRIFHREAPLTMGKLAFFLHPKPLSIGKAEIQLGYVPKIGFHDGTTLAIAWYLQNGWL